jgi:predicted Fe-Mo cluster-binding NifX family protein
MKTLRIAVTSQNYRTVTPHAGKTRRFLVFEAGPERPPVEIERLDLDHEMTMHEFRDREGAHPLDGMDVLITGSAGEGFVRKLATRGVRVVVTGETDPQLAIADLLRGKITPPNPHDCDHHDHGHHGGGHHDHGQS